LEQGYIITKRGANKPLAKQFSEHMSSKHARDTMTKYGFVLPGEKAGK
jgi:molybdate transport system substrate-binding protein